MRLMVVKPAKFTGGQVVMTQGVAALVEGCGTGVLTPLLHRHFAADFGDLDAEDVATQNAALEAAKADPERAERMMSVYTVEGEKVWIITEWDRSVTTVLLPEEY